MRYCNAGVHTVGHVVRRTQRRQFTEAIRLSLRLPCESFSKLFVSPFVFCLFGLIVNNGDR